MHLRRTSEAHRTALARVGLLALALGLGACPKRATDGLPPCARDASNGRRAGFIERCIQAGDRHFQARATAGELDQALSVYMDALLLDPSSVLVLSRISRAYAIKGYAWPDDHGESLRLAMEYGQRCMRTAPDVLGAITASGGQLTVRAIGSAEEPLAPCMLWTAYAWARSLQARGVAGASIDLKPLTALARRVVDLSPDQDAGLPHAVLGLSLALAPRPLKPDLTEAGAELELAVARAPWRLSAKVDLATLVYGPRGDQARWTELLENVAAADPGNREAAENAAAIACAKEALKAGYPDPSTWWRSAP